MCMGRMTETDSQSLQASAIDPQLLQAYLATEYTVLGQRPFRLCIDTFSPELLALYRTHGVRCAAFISASNPFSQRFDDAENERRQQAFEQNAFLWAGGDAVVRLVLVR